MRPYRNKTTPCTGFFFCTPLGVLSTGVSMTLYFSGSLVFQYSAFIPCSHYLCLHWWPTGIRLILPVLSVSKDGRKQSLCCEDHICMVCLSNYSSMIRITTSLWQNDYPYRRSRSWNAFWLPLSSLPVLWANVILVPVNLLLLGHSHSQQDTSQACGPSFWFSLSVLTHACLCSQPVTV